jgi:two-component system cell cycle sensor histidine kinase/response regulator CckA
MKHILVADDNVGVAAFVARALPGYHVTLSSNGLEALTLARTQPCDLLITDFVMPALTGEQVASRLRIEKPSVRTLLMTAHKDVVAISDEHLDGRLSKPFGVNALRAKVESLIGGPDADLPTAAAA